MRVDFYKNKHSFKITENTSGKRKLPTYSETQDSIIIQEMTNEKKLESDMYPVAYNQDYDYVVYDGGGV